MADPKKTAKNKARILIVEDSPTQLEALKFLLESSDFDVITAKDGKEGLSAARGNDIALVISDIVMPGMDGYAFCKALRSDEKLSRTPVILLTSLSDPQDVIRGLESGADSFICKPYEDAALVARVQNVLTNLELRKSTHSELGIDIFFHGQHFLITADRLQILDLLLSTYENAVSRNNELIHAHEELKIANEGLEARVEERTGSLLEEIEAHKRLQAALTRSESLFRLSFDSANIGESLTSPNGEFLRINDAFCSFLGYERSELENKCFSEFTHPDDIGKNEESVRPLWSGEPPSSRFEKRYLRKDGSVVWADVSTMLLKDPQSGEPLCFITHVVDISERKTAEERERLAIESLELLARPIRAEDSIRDILLLFKEKMGFDAVGIRLREGDDFPYFAASGFSEDFMLEERYLRGRDTAGEAIRESRGDPVLKCMCGNVLLGRTDPKEGFFTKGGSFWTNSITRLPAMATADGRTAKPCIRCSREGFESIALILLKAGTRTVGLMQFNGVKPEKFDLGLIEFLEGLGASIGVALTRKLTEDAQRESDLRYRRLFESAKDGILILDAETGMIVDANPSVLNLIGYPIEEICRKRVWELGILADIVPNMENFRELSNKGYLRYEDMPLERASGERIDVEFVCNAYLVNDKKVIQCNIRDISERVRAEAAYKKLEEQLRVSQKLEAIGSLAGGIAHDFNNLICVIMNYAGFASGRIRPEDRAIKDDIDEVMIAAERAAVLTRQLLAFSRKQVLQPVPLDLNEIASGLEKMLRRILGEDIDYVQTLAPDLGLILADPGQIEQVAMNLVVNARDAMPQGGKLTIETSNAEIDGEYAGLHPGVVPGPYARLTITDTGFGMDKETMARIFDPFFTTKEQGKGTGLGLSTVYGIVKQSSGNISVYSEPGEGTSFKIFFPRLPATIAKITPSRREPLAPAMGKETILITDDEESMRRLAQRILSEAGYKILTAGSGEEAIKIAEEYAGKIHLLLTDVVMPNMSGRSLSQKIAERRTDMRIVFMSGYTDDAIAHHGVLEPGTLFLGKPFTAADLRQKIRAALDGGGTGDANRRDEPVMDDPVKDARLSEIGAFGALPDGFLIEMRKAVKAARYDEIISLTETIQAASPDAAARLRRMAELFDYIGLQDVLSRIEGKRGAE